MSDILKVVDPVVQKTVDIIPLPPKTGEKHVVLQFSTTVDSLANWTSALIRRMTHSQFSHVDFVLLDGSLLGASDQGKDSPFLVGNPCGVAIRPHDYQPWGLRRRMILETHKAEAVIDAAKTQLGKPFDNEALRDFFSDAPPGTRDWRDVSAWFCAELVIWALEVGKFWHNQLQWPKNRVSATDVLLLNMMDDRWLNRDSFWLPVPSLTMGPYEH